MRQFFYGVLLNRFSVAGVVGYYFVPAGRLTVKMNGCQKK